MKPTFEFDDSQLQMAIAAGAFTVGDMLDIEKPVAMSIVNRQRELVPVDTSATQNSIGQHIQKATGKEVIDHIGPETDYAPYIEFGVPSKPNYPIQAFVRPSIFTKRQQIINVAIASIKRKLVEKYGRS